MANTLNVKNIHGIKIEKLNSAHELGLSKTINKSARIENLKNDKKLFLQNFSENKSNSLARAKIKITELNIAIPAIKKSYKVDKRNLKHQLENEISKIESKREVNLIADNKVKVNAKYERIAEYLKHKYMNDVKTLENKLSESTIKWDKELQKSFKVDENKIDTSVTLAKEQYATSLIEMEVEFKKRLQSTHDKKTAEKTIFAEKKIKINEEFKVLKQNKKQEFADKKNTILSEFRTAKEEVKINQIYFNAFGEAVSETSLIELSDLDKYAYKTPLIKGANKAQLKLLQKIEKLGTKIAIIQNNYTGSFDQKVNLIELRVKVKYFIRMLNVHIDANDKIETLSLKLYDIDSEEKRQEIKTRQMQDLLSLKETFKQRKADIKSGYAHGKFSKLSYKNSMAESKKNFTESRKEVFYNNEISSLKGQIKYINYQIKNDISKESKIMYSEIDDSQRNIPTKFNKNAIWYSTIASLLLPGTGQLLNKQYIKGILMLFLSLFIYAMLLPMSFGVISFRGDGVFGLGVLSPIIGDSSSGGYIYLDARYRIVEGVLSVIALTIAVALIYLSARDANKVARASWFGGRPKNARDLRSFLTNKGLPMVLSTPAIFMILLVVVLPLATTVLLAFTDYSSLTQPPGNGLSWVGWHNFKRVFIGDYGKSFAFVSMWTMMWTVGTTAGTIIVGTLLALAVDNQRIKGKTMWFMIYILPWAVPAFATILFFTAAFTNGGLFNDFFNVDTNFKQSTNWTRVILITIQVWLGNAYIFMLMSGVKKSISSDYYEAASMDGASKNRQFWSITAPIILFQIMPLLIGQVIFNFNNYGVIWMFNDGGPSTADSLIGNPGSTDIIISFIFKLTTNSQNRIALASAFTIVVSLGVVSLAAIGFFRSKSFKEDKL